VNGTLPDDRTVLLSRIDLADLWLELVGPPGRSGGWPCPNPEHSQTGQSPPVSVDNERGLWCCHGCDGAAGTAVDLVKLALGLPTADAFAWLRRRAGMERPDPPHGRDTPDRVFQGFLDARRWCPEVASRFGIHAVRRNRHPRIRFPFRSGDEVVTWQDRAVDDTKPKFVAAPGRKLVLYADDLEAAIDHAAAVRSAMLVEGPPDAVALAHAFPTGAVFALPGAEHHRNVRMAEVFAGLDVIVAMDNDQAGEKARTVIAGDLAAVGCRVAHLRCPEGCNDLDDWRRACDADDDLWRTEMYVALDALEWEPAP
jgi:5S rRNA maturation endonuclease (ribonuclease M5)